MSSGEAELYSVNKSACGGLGLLQTCLDLGFLRRLDLHTDASATKGIVMRKGSGRLKHIKVQELWLQQLLTEDHVSITKIPRELNSSDALTHHWTSKEGDKHFPRMGVIFCS